MTPSPRTRSLLIAGWASALLLLLILGMLLLRSLLHEDGGVAGILSGGKVAEVREREVMLYFAAEGAEGLRGEPRVIPIAADVTDEVRSVIEGLLEGPRHDLVPTLDPRVKLLNVYVIDRVAVLDFSAELQTTSMGGSITELLLIYSLVDSITTNFPTIESVQILVEGEEIDTVNGHVDARFPFRGNPDWILPGVAS